MAPASTGPAISALRVSKSFLLPHERYSSVKERVLHPLASRSYETLHALRDVSVEVEQGEFFGVVGKNGSGKSTLLRCVSGIYPPDSGAIAVHGRLASFIELGLGFHPELAARENVITSAVMFGLSPREAARRFDAILAFAELERFADQKLKNYSTGMTVRLAFAVTVHVEADILLFDEVLGVGDSSFKRKCYAHFDRLRAEGRTMVLVTHNMELVRSFCDRALLLHQGEAVALGDPDVIAGEYEGVNAGREPTSRRVAKPSSTVPPKAARSPLLGPDPRRFLTLMKTLAVTDFRLKYAGTTLNYLWAVARPLSLFAVLLLVFTTLGRFGSGVPHYPAMLLTSVVLWTFFSQATAASVQCLVTQAPILRKLPFPHLAVPLSVMTTAFFDLGINLAFLLAVVLGSGIAPTVGWLELPALIALLGVLTTGLALLLAALYVRYRDVDQVWLVASQAIFFLSPIFYPVSMLPEPFDRVLVLVNPLATIFTEARHAFIDPGSPSAASVAGSTPLLLVPLAIAVGLFALGVWVFRRESPGAAEHV